MLYVYRPAVGFMSCHNRIAGSTDDSGRITQLAIKTSVNYVLYSSLGDVIPSFHRH